MVARIAVPESSAHQTSFRFVQSVIMKAIAAILVMLASILVHGQTPAPVKSTPSKTGAAHTTAAGTRPSLLNPASLKLKAPAVFKAKFTTTASDFVVEVHRD